MLREETHTERNAIIFLRRWSWQYWGNSEKWKSKEWKKTKLLLTISQTRVKVMCECGPVGKKTQLTFATSVEGLLRWYLACQWSVHFHPDTHPLNYSHQNSDLHSLFLHRKLASTGFAEPSCWAHTHTNTHQWSGKSMAGNWAAWSSGHTRMQGPAVWNETNEGSVEKQMTQCRGQGSVLLACPTSLSHPPTF